MVVKEQRLGLQNKQWNRNYLPVLCINYIGTQNAILVFLKYHRTIVAMSVKKYYTVVKRVILTNNIIEKSYLAYKRR